jgi:hypothetical protein
MLTGLTSIRINFCSGHHNMMLIDKGVQGESE